MVPFTTQIFFIAAISLSAFLVYMLYKLYLKVFEGRTRSTPEKPEASSDAGAEAVSPDSDKESSGKKKSQNKGHKKATVDASSGPVPEREDSHGYDSSVNNGSPSPDDHIVAPKPEKKKRITASAPPVPDKKAEQPSDNAADGASDESVKTPSDQGKKKRIDVSAAPVKEKEALPISHNTSPESIPRSQESIQEVRKSPKKRIDVSAASADLQKDSSLFSSFVADRAAQSLPEKDKSDKKSAKKLFRF